MDDLSAQVAEAWRTNNRINLYLIDHISPRGMKCTLSRRGGRNVVRQFCHLHNARIWHLEKRARDLAEGLDRYGTYDEPGKAALKAALKASADRVETFLLDLVAGKPKRRGMKKGVLATLGYLVAHDAHHRGNILLTLKQSGHNLDQATRFAIWDWDKR